MSCKATLKGRDTRFCKSTDYECKRCHKDLPEEAFDAGSLAKWTQERHHHRITCKVCQKETSWEWWTKKADSDKYACSTCTKSCARTHFTNDAFSLGDLRVCMDCELEKLRPKLDLDNKRFACQGPCNRKELEFTAFEQRHFLRHSGQRELGKLLCRQCVYPVCVECQHPNEEAVPFGPAAKAEMIQSMGKQRWKRPYERHFVCEYCKYPPCCGCGKLRERKYKRTENQRQFWFCHDCIKKPRDADSE